jgi:signal transduction histidine kinase
MMGNNSTGLGLPICKELATQMGGDIIVNSAEGCGTTIWVVIPCQATLIEKKPITV